MKSSEIIIYIYNNIFFVCYFLFFKFWEYPEVLWLHEETFMSGSIADIWTMTMCSFDSHQCTVLPCSIENKPLWIKGQTRDKNVSQVAWSRINKRGKKRLSSGVFSACYWHDYWIIFFKRARLKTCIICLPGLTFFCLRSQNIRKQTFKGELSSTSKTGTSILLDYEFLSVLYLVLNQQFIKCEHKISNISLSWLKILWNH